MRWRWLWMIGALLLATWACTIQVGGPTPPAPPIVPPPDAAESVRQTWEQALAAADAEGRITVTLTEAQLTGLLAAKMAADPDALFQHPQVYLRDGQIQIYGQLQQGYLVANVLVVLQVTIDDQGVPHFQLAQADFGPWPVPEGLLSSLSAMLNEAFTGSIGPALTGLRVESVTITDGTLTIVGRIR